MNIIGVIPSRFASSRFPGKPLAMINGKSMIRRVWEQALKSEKLNKVFVATDDTRIYDHVKGFGGSVLMTSGNHPNGTARCAEVLDILSLRDPQDGVDALINIQGDEPYINPLQIDQLAGLFTNADIEIATLVRKIADNSDLSNPNAVKVVWDNSGKALYFSRQAIPYIREVPEKDWLAKHGFFKHIGIYGYRPDILSAIVRMKPGELEKAEELEQLRWLEHGIQITVAMTEFESPSVDTPEDLSKLTNSG